MSAKVLTRVKTWISLSGLTEGARLPAERDLCATLGTSRAELRKALLVLEVEGLLARQVGRGTFLAKPPEVKRSGSMASTIADLAERTGPNEAMIARIALEPELARMAALSATPRQLRDLRSLSDRMRHAQTWHDYEEQDAAFHDLVAEASGNSLLHELHKIMNGVRLVVVWRRLSTPMQGPTPDYRSFDEHDAIVTALENRAGPAAHRAMLSHLEGTLSKMRANNTDR
jgi:DNA-binding FadR family transcriptional regulator